MTRTTLDLPGTAAVPVVISLGSLASLAHAGEESPSDEATEERP